uniref:Cytochrome P450, family 2, subfamily V, polypeptide 1 n=1 Tax=Erpetoichthys calabaricus TaxID=27687 RepID=A0A8C4TJN3_ERPCA
MNWQPWQANMGLAYLLVFIAVFLLVTDYVKNRSPKNFPPSPPGLPFVGNVFHLDPKQPHINMKKVSVYGNVFSLRLGRSRIVVVNGYKMAKEALVNQPDAVPSRPSDPMFERINKLYGVVLSSGYRWKQHRRFMLTTLRNFGVGKKSLESTIIEELGYFRQAIQEEQGRPFEPHFLINNAIANIICSMVFGRRFEYTLKHMERLSGMPPGSLPCSKKLLVVEFLRSEIEEHKKDWDPAAPRDFIDCYLEEIEMVTNLSYTLLDLFVAGTETTSTTLRWALLYLMKYQDVQEKVQKEIDAVLGRDQPPSMQDRTNLPYTDAVIHEIQRMADIVPLNMARKADEEFSLGGCIIPKNTTVLVNLNSVLFDEEEWDDPFTFKPERFLDANGKFSKNDAFFVFSAGKRSCLGEPLARMELFLFFTSLLQRFTFQPPEGVEPTLDFQMGLTRVPVLYNIRAIPR